jgi:syntaxin 8
MSNPSQLFLLADHIKLSLLERQRAISLSIDPDPSQDAQISRSLESFREGIESLTSRSSDTESLTQLRNQYNDLSKQFHGESSSTLENTLLTPNDEFLREDFAHAAQQPTIPSAPDPSRQDPKKNVRFRDDPSQDSVAEPEDPNRAALFPQRYTDEPVPAPDPTAQMDNQQIHEYHSQVIAEQDDQLDTLSESIGRQRHLSMQIGDELEGQVALLDEVDRGVDRHQGRLDGAKRRLNGVAKVASRNWGMTTIVVLIVILVLLIIVLK